MTPLSDFHADKLGEAAEAVSAAKAAHDNALARREDVIRWVASAGGNYRDIGHAAGVSYQRVHQIVTGRPVPTRKPDESLEDFLIRNPRL